MPILQVHGEGSGQSSPIPGAKFAKINNNLTAMQEKAAADAQKSSVPWANDKWKRANDAFAKQMEQAAARGAGPAREAFESAIPWLNPKIRTINANLAKAVEQDAKRAAQVQQRQLADNARLQKQAAATKARQEKALYGSQYREAADLNRRYDATDPMRFHAREAARLGASGAGAGWRQQGAANRGLSALGAQYGHHPRVAQAIRSAKMLMASRGGSGGGVIGQIASSGSGSMALEMLEAVGIDVGEFAAAGVMGPAGLIGLAGYKAAKAAAQSPYTLANLANGVMGSAQPYMSLRGQYAGIGRASNLDSRAVEARFSSDDPRLNALGIGPTEGARILSSYGVTQRSADQSADVAATIAEQQYAAGGLGGLGTDRYIASARFAQSAGLTLPNEGEGTDQASGLARYFKMLGTVTTAAVAAGMDRSQAIASVEGLLRQGASAGAAGMGGGEGVSSLVARLMGGGTAPDRMGVTAGNMMQGALSLPDKIGFSGDSFHMGVMGSALQSLGGPRAFADPKDAALIKIIGQPAYNSFTQTETGNQLINNLREAARSGSGVAVQNALGPLIKGNTDADTYLANKSYLNTLPGYYRKVATANFLGVDQTSYASNQATGRNRGIDNNNPLNLEYRPGQPGVIGNDGRFGKYGSMEAGVASAENQLLLYQDRGKRTVRSIISTWAPASDGNDTASYIAQVCQQMGVSPDQPLNLNDASKAQKLILAMAKRETGKTLDAGTVQRGVAMRLGLPYTPMKSPYGTIAPGNNMDDINVASARTDAFNVNAGMISTDLATGALSGPGGKLAFNTSAMATRIDRQAIEKGGDIFNGLISATATSVSGLSALTDAAHSAAAALSRIGGLRYNDGRSVLTGQNSQNQSPMRR